MNKINTSLETLHSPNRKRFSRTRLGLILSGAAVLTTSLVACEPTPGPTPDTTTTSSTLFQGDNAERQADIDTLQSRIEEYHLSKGIYPTFYDLNDLTWVATNMYDLDREVLRDPTNNVNFFLATVATTGMYAYQTQPEGCDNTTMDCTQYTLTAVLNGGGLYVQQNQS